MMAKFNADQQLAYDNANREQRVRGMPDHSALDYMAMNPLKFPGMQPGSLTCDPTPPPEEPLGSRRSNAAKRAEQEAARSVAEAAQNAVEPGAEV